MEFLQLRYFMESAENESFSKAAEKYQVPATSVSAAIKRLERELGCPLFRRSYNSIALNEKGRLFLESVRIAFEISILLTKHRSRTLLFSLVADVRASSSLARVCFLRTTIAATALSSASRLSSTTTSRTAIGLCLRARSSPCRV